jgi:SAM-dependent methyltransferase
MDRSVYEDMYRLERKHWWFRARREILDSLIESKLPAGSSVLDVGCGTGFILERLRDRYDVHGLDDAEIAVKFCHDKGLTFVEQGILGEVRLSRKHYDLVTLLDVIEHVDDDVGLLRAAKDVLSPGGKVLVTVPAHSFLWSQHDVIHHHRRRYDRPMLTRALNAAGLQPTWMSYFNTLLFPLIAAARIAGKIAGDKASDADNVPASPVNEVLYRMFRAEQSLLPRLKLPVGVSIACLAEPCPS